MRRRVTLLMLTGAVVASAVIIDRIAIIAGNSIIKDSDIQRDVRITDFLNGSPLDLSQAAKKAAADRLLDQVFIRREIRIGDYPTSSQQDADKQLDQMIKERFHTQAAFEDALRRYGLTEAELRDRYQWQLTVLLFIDARFRPAAYISDEELESYYNAHAQQLATQFPGKSSLNDLRDEIRNLLSGQKVNQIFFAWLDEQRKNTSVRYLEGGLT